MSVEFLLFYFDIRLNRNVIDLKNIVAKRLYFCFIVNKSVIFVPASCPEWCLAKLYIK